MYLRVWLICACVWTVDTQCAPRRLASSASVTEKSIEDLLALAQQSLSKKKNVDTSQVLEAASSYLLNTYARPDVVFTSGSGCRMYDSQGREYLDMAGGIAVNCLGHNDPQLVQVLFQQVTRAPRSFLFLLLLLLLLFLSLS